MCSAECCVVGLHSWITGSNAFQIWGDEEQSIAVAVKCAPATATCSDALHFVKPVAVAVAALLLEVSATATLINDSYVFIGCVTQIFSLRISSPHTGPLNFYFSD